MSIGKAADIGKVVVVPLLFIFCCLEFRDYIVVFSFACNYEFIAHFTRIHFSQKTLFYPLLYGIPHWVNLFLAKLHI